MRFLIDSSLVPRPFIGETVWQLTQVQTANRLDLKKITAAPIQAMNIGYARGPNKKSKNNRTRLKYGEIQEPSDLVCYNSFYDFRSSGKI